MKRSRSGRVATSKSATILLEAPLQIPLCSKTCASLVAALSSLQRSSSSDEQTLSSNVLTPTKRRIKRRAPHVRKDGDETCRLSWNGNVRFREGVARVAPGSLLCWAASIWRQLGYHLSHSIGFAPKGSRRRHSTRCDKRASEQNVRESCSSF